MSEKTMILPKETAQALVDLTGEVRLDAALTMVMRDYARQKIVELEAGMRQYEQKYGMSFEAYRHIWETEDSPEHYSYAAEDDYLLWEGLVTRRTRLAGSTEFLKEVEAHFQ
ncbi:MAG: hypothetical protein DWI57_07590 [Chloroflexi bacterium]|nr:MAG: hypothetical protein DWI57_07590 [Chloroflexota bacterium]